MAKLLPGLVELVIALIITIAITWGSVHMPISWHSMQLTGVHPLTIREVTDAAKIASLCSTGWLLCAQSAIVAGQNLDNGVHRDVAIPTINDLQRDYFLEYALLIGGEMTLDAILLDAAPKRAFMTASAAKSLPAFTSSDTLNLLKHLGVSPSMEMATSIATAAHLRGYGALPGEKMNCAVSASAMAKLASCKLDSGVYELSPSPVTILEVTKNSVAKGIVVSHALNFSSALYYCHGVTSTTVITATLKPIQGNFFDPIKALGVYYIDTFRWLSTHPNFRALGIPHDNEACHWLVDSDVLFDPTATSSNGVQLTGACRSAS